MSESIRYINGRPMQCKDIPDLMFLEAVREATETSTANVWKVQELLENVMGPIPWNLLLAKARRLIAAGKLTGCACGCRGDFAVPAPPVIAGHGVWVDRLLAVAAGTGSRAAESR
ncbi:hypothetical protein [Streptomyces mexicanus]|uniref:hypothetical protein n=1 Tax=Streptomyces mexicanus TaxID=178566 RepID=UPI00365951CF